MLNVTFATGYVIALYVPKSQLSLGHQVHGTLGLLLTVLAGQYTLMVSTVMEELGTICAHRVSVYSRVPVIHHYPPLVVVQRKINTGPS